MSQNDLVLSHSAESEIAAVEADILRLALKYSFVTPLTAMVVTKPELDDQGGRNGSTASNIADGELGIKPGTDDKAAVKRPTLNHGHMQGHNTFFDRVDYDDFDNFGDETFLLGVSGKGGGRDKSGNFAVFLASSWWVWPVLVTHCWMISVS